MQTLSFGYKKPETGDKGEVFFPALEDNWQRTNDHNHNGTNSAKLPSTSVEAVTHTLAAGGWTDLGGGNYKRTVTVPSGVSLDKHVPVFKLSDGHILYLSMERLTENTYDLFINQAVDITVSYVS